MNDDIVDHLRWQLHDTPMEVERPVCTARSPSETQIHYMDEARRSHTNDALPLGHSVVQAGICGSRIVFGDPLFTYGYLLTTEKQSVTFEANRRNRSFVPLRIHELQTIVPPQEIKAFAINELRAPE